MGILVNENQIGGGGTSNSSHNIGDIFYTTRTDNSLNGAVECNGSQYNFSDFDSNLQNLLDEGKLPYVSIGEFDSMVTNQGGCDSFGYKTPKMVKIYPAGNVTERPFIYIELTDEQYNSFYDTMNNCKDREILPYRLYDINTAELLNGYYLKCTSSVIGSFVVFNNEDEETSFFFIDHGSYYVTTDGSKTIPDPDKSQADPTTYFKVPKKLSRVLVRTQKPTADNNYTWYNVYADGWVEQGGTVVIVNGTVAHDAYNTKAITFPIAMQTTKCWHCQAKHDRFNAGFTNTDGVTTGATVYQVNDSSVSAFNNPFVIWEVKGYATPSEYTRDKWNYQNIQVERCMVQLFNSTTDTAVATCNQVLVDVSALNGQDSVIYWDSYEASDHSHAYSNITLTEHQWYRIYKSGWVEQGGIILNAGVNQHIITIPIEMNDVEELKKGTTVYPIYISGTIQSQGVTVRNSTNSDWSSNTIDCFSWGATIHIKWEVKGYMLSTQS